MRVLLSTYGSRGDVQPMVGLGVHLQSLGHRVQICAPPNFSEFVQLRGMDFFPIGYDLRQGGRYVPGGAATTAARHFAAIKPAAVGCDALIGCAAMQIAAHSVAEWREVPYLYTAYAPVALPSPHHGPLPVYPPHPVDADTHLGRWQQDATWWNTTWRKGLNIRRAALGLTPVDDVRAHVITGRPMLAADPALAPWQTPADLDVVQTGAWLLPDDRPLPTELEEFLDAGEPPIYFGFGSMLTPRAPLPILVAAARAVGRRAVVLRGWATWNPDDEAADWLAVDEANQQALFPRCAAVVHHGGSGTTTTAALAGVPQVLVPHHYDQPYYAQRVATLGIGVAHPAGDPTVESLAATLHGVLSAPVRARALAFVPEVRTDGVARATDELLRRLA